MNTQSIGFVIPLQSEADQLLKFIKNRTKVSNGSRNVTTGTLGSHQCRVIVSGCGKILSAAATQFLIDCHPCTLYIHFGTAGALSPEIKIGDIIAATTVIEYDVKELFPQPVPPPQHRIRSRMLNKLLQRVKTQMVVGPILSGDEDIITTKRRDELFMTHKALSVDWESAGFVRTCNLNKVPCVVFRTISDYAYERTNDEYQTNQQYVLRNLIKAIFRVVESM